jgi:glycosyltransferase involved in cell wall biosynthesis
MKLLVITQKPIFPLNDGGKLAMKALLDDLKCTKNTLHYASICTQKHPMDDLKNTDEAVLSLFINTTVRTRNFFTYLFRGKESLLERFSDASNQKKVLDYIRDNTITHVIFDGFYACTFLESIQRNTKVYTILRAHNGEAEIWKTRAQNEVSKVKHYLFKTLAKKTLALEKKVAQHVNQIWTLTQEDKNYFENLLPVSANSKCFLVPITIPIHPSLVSENNNFNRFYFLGAMDWNPNIVAVDFILNDIYPLLEVEDHLMEITLAGKSMPNEAYEHSQQNLHIEGEIIDLNSFLSKQGTLLAPIFEGGGIKVKIIESMAFGIPVITTKIGAQGIAESGKEGLFFAETAQEFLTQMRYISLYPEKVNAKIKIAQRYIQDHHNSEKNAVHLNTLLSEL